MTPMTDAQLAERIRTTSLLRGEFTLRSGLKSGFYVDKYLFETQPDILAEIARRMAGKTDTQTTRIAGSELGGVAIAAATSLASGLPFLIVRNARKDYGTGRRFEGELERGDRILLVEDIATTGGQVLEAAALLTGAGAEVQRIVAVVDRGQGVRENVIEAGFVFESLLSAQDLNLPKES